MRCCSNCQASRSFSKLKLNIFLNSHHHSHHSSRTAIIIIIIITITITIITQVNAEDMKGEATPLYYAAMAGSEPAVDLLLLYGGDAQNSNSGEKVVKHEV